MNRTVRLAAASGIALATPVCAAVAEVQPAASVPAPAFRTVEGAGSVLPEPVAPDEPRVARAPHVPNRPIRLRVPASGYTLVTFSPGETLFDVLGVLPKDPGGGGAVVAGWRASEFENKIGFSFHGDVGATVVHVISHDAQGRTRRYMYELIPERSPVRLDDERGLGRLVADAAGATGATATDAAPPRRDVPVPVVALDMTYPIGSVGASDRPRRSGSVAVGSEATPSGGGAPVAVSPRPRRRSAGPASERAQTLLTSESVASPKVCNGKGAGDPMLVPVSFCQDGTFSYFVFAGQTPAIFTVDDAGLEHAVDQSPDPARPGVIVARATNRWWIIRIGTKRVAGVYDSAYNPMRSWSGTNTSSPRVQTYIDPAARQ